MAKGRDRETISIWFWLFSMFVMVIPFVNVVMTLVWAFSGENESRKNYFKALIVIFFAGIGLALALFSLGMLPVMLEFLRKLPK